MPGLYLHIPFCVRKCLYCDFYSLPAGQGPLSRRLAKVASATQPDFLDALAIELKTMPSDFVPDTIFLGGGTPTELADEDFARLFELIKTSIDTRRVQEWTCESNPGTLTEVKVDIMVSAGVNRVSLGVQSLTPSVLDFLGRIHSPEEALAGYCLLREKGIRNINLDFMYGVPGQSMEMLRQDLERALALEPDHLAVYCLIFEDGTPLAELRNKGYVKEVDDDLELEQYQWVRDKLTSVGFLHYEISNYARPGRACRHNMIYWSGGEYIGCGPSAHSHWRGKRWGNIRSLEQYQQRIIAGQSVRQFEEELPPDARARETLIMALRRIHGISKSEFKATTGYDYEDLCGDQIRWLQEIGMLEHRGNRLRLTPQGVFVSDAVFAELV